MALWHEGGLGDVIDSAHLAIALRRAYQPDYLVYYLRRPIQNDLAFCLHYDGKPIFDATIQTDIPWEECVSSEACRWDRFIDWRPYIPIEYESLKSGEPSSGKTHRARTKGLPSLWEECYRELLRGPAINLLHGEQASLHEIACTALGIPTADIEDMEIAEHLPVRLQYRWLAKRPFLTLGTGSDAQTGVRLRQTKEWADAKWAEVIRLLKERRPDVRVIQVGKRGETRIPGTLCLLGRTTIAELLWLLKASRLHMACENGTVRIAKACGTDSVVVFGPTSHHLYGLPGNVVVRTPACEPCNHRTREWMTKCPNQWNALCMVSVAPNAFVQAVCDRLDKQDALLNHDATPGRIPEIQHDT